MLLLDFDNGDHGMLHVGSPNIAGAGLRHSAQTVVISGSNGLSRPAGTARLRRSQRSSARRGQSAAEELAVSDIYFAGADRADRSASLRSSQSDPGCSSTPSLSTALFVRISVTVTPSSASSGRHSPLREPGLEQDRV